MRMMVSVLSLLFAGVVGCGAVEDSPSEATAAGEVAGGDGQSVICPQFCGLDTLCRFPDGSCTEPCNSCLCRAAGGTVVTSCGKQASPQALSLQASPIDDHGVIGQACGNMTCGNITCG